MTAGHSETNKNLNLILTSYSVTVKLAASLKTLLAIKSIFIRICPLKTCDLTWISHLKTMSVGTCEHLCPEHTVHMVKHGGGSIIVWVCFSPAQTWELDFT
ncbi:hypothetical protein XENOCAPTIV_029298 [Xenoophorus captivus]|uniref:Uncharacterized protein n=1 Tax=Xenoophorus captivus TaxID=1517983 RepID=A0ABV0QX57_9TELE